MTPTKDAEYLLIWNNTDKLDITFTVENLGKRVPILESELSEKIKSLGLVSSIDVDNMKSGIKGFTATNVPSGLPKLDYAGSNFIITIKSDDSVVSSFDSQFLFINNEIKARRSGRNNSWLNWRLIHKKDYVVDVNGSGDYTNFTECIKFINDNQIKNANVFVKDGIYDLVAEAKLIYGDDYFETITNNYSSGIKLYNNITIECEQNALLKFVYTGSNVNVLEGYSVFTAKADSDGYTLLNVNIYVKNGRYCVHDEHDGYSTYKNIYEGCRMEIDNSENHVWHATQCIGGGLGLHGTIKVNNCYFKTFKHGVNDYCVSYHNGVSANAKSNVVISNNYCEQGTIKASWYGQSTEKTDFLIYGNSVPNPIVVKRENSDYDVNNISVKEWNNEIRTN